MNPLFVIEKQNLNPGLRTSRFLLPFKFFLNLQQFLLFQVPFLSPRPEQKSIMKSQKKNTAKDKTKPELSTFLFQNNHFLSRKPNRGQIHMKEKIERERRPESQFERTVKALVTGKEAIGDGSIVFYPSSLRHRFKGFTYHNFS